jgi:CheY-like chemotaxis protein
VIGMVNSGMPSVQEQTDNAKRTVLLVEDHFQTRWSAAEFLRHGGYRVVEAVNVAEAMGVMRCGAHVDIVFSDVNMPGDQDGYELAQWLEQDYPQLPVLLTSGDPQNPTALNSNPLRRFIRKPYDPSEVEKILLSMLESLTKL